ncbi:MAG: alpha-1,2-fucosyltransferase [Lachnospiraceae bacterium]|nr:alpha-1,2-fucosyltransferase [Lachnospiraceae bacterium]
MLKIQFLNGGLANQVFQYIFARSYELSHPNEKMFLDDSYFAVNTVHNGYELEKVFGIRPHMLSELFDEDVWQYILTEREKGKSIPQLLKDNGSDIVLVSEMKDIYRTFNPFDGEILILKEKENMPEVLDMQGNVYYHGYWICREWFDRNKDVFLRELTFPKISDDKNKRLIHDIAVKPSLAIHVRRGDYVGLKIAYEAQNYKELIDVWTNGLGTDWNLYVFSDDINWCKANSKEMGFEIFKSVCYVEGNTAGKNYIDMQLMSQCKGMIISNSAFSFLAALLNTNKLACLGPDFRNAM